MDSTGIPVKLEQYLIMFIDGSVVCLGLVAYLDIDLHLCMYMASEHDSPSHHTGPWG